MNTHEPSTTITPERIRDGLPASYIAKATSLGLDRGRVLRIVGADSTLRRKVKDGAKLSRDESDRLARVMRIATHAIEVFGSRDKAVHWLTRPSRHLTGRRAPIDMLDTDPGAEWVSTRLDQIAYGLFA